MSKVYIDITDFLTWKGNFTGIQRVIYNVTKELSTSSNVSLIVYDQGSYQLLKQSIYSIAKEGVHEIPHQSKEEKFIKRLRALYDDLPTPIRYAGAPLAGLAFMVLRQSMPLTRRLLHTARAHGYLVDTSILNITKYGPRVLFEPNDHLVLLGCLWDSVEHLDHATYEARNRGLILTVLVYDLLPIYSSHTFGQGLLPMYTRYLFELLSVASSVMTISKASAKDIRLFMSEVGIINKPSITVLRLGDVVVDKGRKATMKQRQQYKEKYKQKPFAISVGTIEARKNHQLLYMALKYAVEKKLMSNLPHVYIIGRPGWLTSDLLSLFYFDNDVKDHVTILSDVTDSELAWLYENSLFSIYVSQKEGWGLPIAESLTYSTPVITSDTSSMVEIAPQLTRRVSPFDSRALAEEMLSLTDEKTNDILRRRISVEYKPVAWAATGRQVLSAMEKGYPTKA